MKGKKLIIISSSIQNELVKLAKNSLPYESCGLLFGSALNNKIMVTFVEQMKNIKKSSTEFSIDPDELFQKYRTSVDNKFDIVGIFHSHPGLPIPSYTDLFYMEINPIVWVIYSTTVNKLRAFLFEYSLSEFIIKNE